MKYLLLLADGMADYKYDILDGKTVLQYAHTPNMDKLAPLSSLGMARTVPEGYPPGSDVANLAVMGYDPRRYYTGRSPLEAVSLGVAMGDQDLSLRCNLVTLSSEENYADKTMLDYSAGEISSAESAQLIEAVSSALGNAELNFHAGISYRHLLLWKNARGKSLQLTPPHDISDRKIGTYLPQGDDSQMLLQMMQASQAILAQHPVNLDRIEKGLNPANSIWLWGEGSRPAMDSFASKYGLQGSVVCAVDLVKGLGICAGLTPIKVEGATGGIKTNFAGKARAALDELKGGRDFVYLHIESPDEAGHQGEIMTKVWAIEQIDQHVLGLVLEELDDFDDLRLLVMPDHPTPIAIKTHSSDPVPFMLYDKNHPRTSSAREFNEITAGEGMFFEDGYQLMDYFINGSDR
jgi:2,3-bisphosphoglycerate-independent phosphoglycerate mutase